jgi:hypothetical protein
MASAASFPLFYLDVESIFSRVIYFASLLIEVVAFVHCLLQRKDAFRLVGSIPKGGWLGILAGCVLITAVVSYGPFQLLGYIALTATAFYLLDVRAGLREATGSGS